MEFKKAQDLEAAWQNFEPSLNLPFPEGEPFFVHREDKNLKRLRRDILRSVENVKTFFLCGHTGSGKTTELNRLEKDPELNDKFYTIFTSSKGFDPQSFTHIDILMLIGFKIYEAAIDDKSFETPTNLKKELEDWSSTIVKIFDKEDSIDAEVKAGAGVWITSFIARLKTRTRWKEEKRKLIEPKLNDLINIIDKLAIHIKVHSGKPVLIIMDDLEKGTTLEKKKELFSTNYSVLTSPHLHTLFTLPMAFRSMPDKEIPPELIYTYPSVKIYKLPEPNATEPVWNNEGKAIMESFIKNRMELELAELDALDELILIGNGIFRETCRAMQLAIDHTIENSRKKINMEDAKFVFDEIKKEFQPIFRGDKVEVFRSVLQSHAWVEGVEPLIYANAVVEYENSDSWLDLRHPIKELVQPS
jgi:hypothetical protein